MTDDVTLAVCSPARDDRVQFTIRDYRPEDFEVLWEIDQQCFPPGISYSKYELKTYICWRNAFTLVVEIAGTEAQRAATVGFLVAASRQRGVGHIVTIDVLSEARRHGLGSTLLRMGEERFRASGYRSVRLETAVDNLGALAFYKRHGYDVVKTVPRYYSNGVDALLLEKDLLSPVSSG
jgi:[ribosomal protein S18]-alanine N-acetyltransferase